MLFIDYILLCEILFNP